MSETSIKIDIGCRDDTVPKTVDTRRHRKVCLRACNNLPQLHLSFCGLWKIVACSELYIAVPSCVYLQFLAQC